MEWCLFLGCNILLLFEFQLNKILTLFSQSKGQKKKKKPQPPQKKNTKKPQRQQQQQQNNNVHCGKNGLYVWEVSGHYGFRRNEADLKLDNINAWIFTLTIMYFILEIHVLALWLSANNSFNL